jgi:hypothetical protein
MRLCWILVCSLLSIALAGCGAAQVNSGNTPKLTPPDPKETETLSTPSPVTPKEWDDMPQDPPLLIPTNPDLEALIEKAKADLAERLSVQTSQIKSIESKEVVWPDTSLGCPQPGMAYAQMLTPGYIIRLMYSGSEFEYHADIHSNTLYCENPTPPISGIIAPP